VPREEGEDDEEEEVIFLRGGPPPAWAQPQQGHAAAPFIDDELKDALKGVVSEVASLGMGLLGLGMEALLEAGARQMDRMAAEQRAQAEAAGTYPQPPPPYT
jgi:hypothetical protein